MRGISSVGPQIPHIDRRRWRKARPYNGGGPTPTYPAPPSPRTGPSSVFPLFRLSSIRSTRQSDLTPSSGTAYSGDQLLSDTRQCKTAADMNSNAWIKPARWHNSVISSTRVTTLRSYKEENKWSVQPLNTVGHSCLHCENHLHTCSAICLATACCTRTSAFNDLTI